MWGRTPDLCFLGGGWGGEDMGDLPRSEAKKPTVVVLRESGSQKGDVNPTKLIAKPGMVEGEFYDEKRDPEGRKQKICNAPGEG